MQILDYKHIVATERRENYFAIPELDRYKPSVNQFIELANLDIELVTPTGFIYVDGFTISQAESGICKGDKYSVALCTGSSYIMHKWITSFKTPEYITAATVVNGTCASGIQALMVAEQWLLYGMCREVIIIGGERITEDTLRLFRELGINIMCGDGFVYIKLKGGPGGELFDIKWEYAYNTNPFSFEKYQLNTLIPTYPVNYVKLHGTGTQSNTEAESGLEQLAVPLAYKDIIGHTQGISSLLEMCMVLSSDTIKGTILVVANGVGGFYGSCTLHK